MADKTAMSPLVTTFLLIIFSLVIGSVIMQIGKNYISNLETSKPAPVDSIIVAAPDNELKQLQLDYINNKITYEEYLAKEQLLVKK